MKITLTESQVCFAVVEYAKDQLNGDWGYDGDIEDVTFYILEEGGSTPITQDLEAEVEVYIRPKKVEAGANNE